MSQIAEPKYHGPSTQRLSDVSTTAATRIRRDGLVHDELAMLGVAAVLVLITAASCTFMAPVAPTADPSDTFGTAPLATGSGVATEPTSLAEVVTDRVRSDRFWQSITHFAAYGYRYDSMDEMVADAHLIVRGRVTSLRAGTIDRFEDGGPRGTDAMRVTFGIVTITEVLKGDPQSRDAGTIEVARLGWSWMTEDDLPSEEVLLFLKNYAQMRVEEGAPVASTSDDRFHYARANGYQCALRNLDGVVDLVDGPPGWEQDFGPFPSDQNGRPFADVVVEVRQLAGSSSNG
jgi:hypothetical protein